MRVERRVIQHTVAHLGDLDKQGRIQARQHCSPQRTTT
jgi:hypothetical protein